MSHDLRLEYRNIIIGLIFSLAIIFNTSALFAGEASLSWDPPTTNTDGSPLTDLNGYIVYYGTESGNYSQSIDVGNVTTYTVINLTPGTTYYFAVTAYDTSGNESAYSNEVNKVIQDSNPVDYYCDDDSDGYIDASIDGSCTGTGCEPTGCQTVPGNDCNDDNSNIYPGADDSNCNGVDENCDGTPDNDYVPTNTTCGQGVCESTGQLICDNGSLIDTCTAGNPTGDDSDCDGIDDNCDGTPDNNYVSTIVSCGTGVCASIGYMQCQEGTEVNTCVPGTPPESEEVTCDDGLDNDCDGQVDEGCSPAIEVSNVLLSEDFSGGMPNTWSVQGVWNTNNSCNRNIEYPLTEPYAIADSLCTQTENNELVTSSFNTAYCNSVELTFSHQYYWYAGNIEVETSSDGGTTWTSNMYIETDDGYPTPDWKEVDISNVAGVQEARIKFKYVNESIDGFWAFDNIWVTCQTSQVEFSSQTSSSQTLMITNTGTSNLIIDTITIEGSDASYFSIGEDDNCSDQTLSPTESCTFDVIFTSTSSGLKDANLIITSNDPLTPALNIALTGIQSEIENPAPLIKANGLRGSLNLAKGNNLRITVELNAGSYIGSDADWWILMKYRNRWYYYDASTKKWRRGVSHYYQGSLYNMGSVEVLNSSNLHKGQYILYFEVDTNMNGLRESNNNYYDTITVNIE
jgi:hypothetical protein